MAERKRIALNYRTGYDFSAGIVIYIQNLIKGLKLLSDDLRPELIIIYSGDSNLEELKRIDYPYISYCKYEPVKKNLLIRAINKGARILFNTNLIKRYDFPTKADILYPHFETEETFFYKKRLYWKPDFQELHLPEYFSKAELDYTSEFMRRISQNPDYGLVLSSGDAFNDFKKFYSPYKCDVRLLRFISLLPDLSGIDAGTVMKKYGITGRYFLIANQFWPHKNHMLALRALKTVMKYYPDISFVLTGKQSSYRKKDYFQELEKFIADNNLQNNVIMTGFISREEQILLMKNSVSVIQPSLFEGWSTVIEDCKALGKFVIAADLEVNKEQLDVNCSFFKRHDSGELAEKMKSLLGNNEVTVPYDYSKNIEAFKLDLIKVFELDS